jgi:PHD/YefM family antitoxin component YafN of YafNO toxin-antitoxin module
MDINKKFIVDEKGNPKEVIIPVEDFRKIEELLGWDLDEEAVQQLREAKRDRERGNKEAYQGLDSI